MGMGQPQQQVQKQMQYGPGERRRGSSRGTCIRGPGELGFKSSSNNYQGSSWDLGHYKINKAMSANSAI